MPFLALFSAVLLLGIADSMVNSYIVLFAADRVGLTPLQIGVVSSVVALSAIGAGWWAGRLFDRRPARVYAVAVVLLGAVGYLVLPAVPGFLVLLVVSGTLLGSVGAAFPQLFSLARSLSGGGSTRTAPLLRSGWSLAWAVGPLLGALLLSRGGYGVLMWSASGVFVLCALTIAGVPAPPPRPADVAHDAGGPTPVLLTASVVLFFGAMFAGGLALPLFVTRGLHQPAASVGLLFSLCAAVEVVVALVLATLPARVSQRWVILVGFAAFVVYYALTIASSTMAALLVGQAFRGIGIAVVGAAGISYFQELLAPATGRATTLYANSSTAGLLVSGILGGVAIEHAGYRGTLLLCGAASAIGGVMFLVGSRRHVKAEPARSPA